jgi:hypothetical protein
MPRNNVTNITCSNSPYFQCPCGYSKTFERACDIKKGVARHTRFCEIAKTAIHMEAGVYEYTRESGQGTTTTTTVTPAVMKVSKK